MGAIGGKSRWIEAKNLDSGMLLDNAEVGGTVPWWEWIGDEGATTFSY